MILALLVVSLHAMDFEVFELPNGIRVIFQQRKSSIVHVGLMINAGARDELKENPSGTSVPF